MLALVLVMFGFGFALVPIYDVMCQAFGITQRTLRFYETKGLLEPRRVNGTRVYTRRDRARLALILRSKAIGAPLAEIKRYLDLYGAHGEGREKQLSFVLQRTDATIAELEQKRAHIDATLAELPPARKNQISHRARAAQAARAVLERWAAEGLI